MSALSDPRDERFCQHYFRFANREAAIAYSGYKRKSAKEKSNSAAVLASELLKEPKIIRRITELLEAAAARALLSKRRVLNEAARVAFCDARKLFDPEGRLIPVHDLDENTAATIASVEVETIWERDGREKTAIGEVTKIKLWPKVQALDLLAKYYKLYEKDEKEAGDSYHYHFYCPDNQRTNEPIVLNGANGHDPEAVLQLPDNGHGEPNGTR